MIPWTATRINAANYCRMQYYLRYIEGEKPLKLSAYVKGSFLHSIIEKFWEKLGTEEEVAKKSSGKKYSNAEEFAKYSQGLWMKQLIAARHSEEKVVWRYQGEEYAAHSNLPSVCVPLFHFLTNEGPPLFSEIEFDFVAENTRFRGRIDDIRIRDGRVIIRDYKSGRPWLGEMKVSNDPQLTIYNAGLCSLCVSDDEIAGKLGLMEKRAGFMKDFHYIFPDFIEQFFMIEAPALNAKRDSQGNRKFHPLKTIHETRRRDEHFNELLKLIQGIEKAVSDGEIYPERGRKCDDCDLKYACEKRLNQVGTGHLEDKTGQGFFSFAIPAYARTEEQSRDRVQKDFGQGKIRFKWK